MCAARLLGDDCLVLVHEEKIARLPWSEGPVPRTEEVTFVRKGAHALQFTDGSHVHSCSDLYTIL